MLLSSSLALVTESGSKSALLALTLRSKLLPNPAVRPAIAAAATYGSPQNKQVTCIEHKVQARRPHIRRPADFAAGCGIGGHAVLGLSSVLPNPLRDSFVHCHLRLAIHRTTVPFWNAEPKANGFQVFRTAAIRIAATSAGRTVAGGYQSSADLSYPAFSAARDECLGINVIYSETANEKRLCHQSQPPSRFDLEQFCPYIQGMSLCSMPATCCACCHAPCRTMG